MPATLLRHVSAVCPRCGHRVRELASRDGDMATEVIHEAMEAHLREHDGEES